MMKCPASLAVALATALFATTLAAASAPEANSIQADAGETLTVTTLDDVSDFTGLHTVNDLPGPDGLVSFREAVTAANNTAGPQTIAFAIPASTFWLIPNVGLLRLEQGPFFLNDSATTVDFTTQTANIGNTNPDGPEIGIYGLEPNGAGVSAIIVIGNNCVIKGLGKVYQRGYAVQLKGNGNRVTGCQIDGPLHAAVYIVGDVGGAVPTGNTIGGSSLAEGNTLVGLTIEGPAEANVVTGNALLVGVRVQGATQFGAVARNNRIEHNLISGAGSYGEEGFPTGDQLAVIDADGTIVDGNFIGTTADGMGAYPQIGPIGVEVRDSRSTTIRNNLIAGLRVAGFNHAAGMIFGQAILVNAVNDHTTNTIIEGNSIGLAVDRVTPITTRAGIAVSPQRTSMHAFGTRIAANHVAFVETTGILVSAPEDGVTITGNSIHDCGALGIDLSRIADADGPTANDAGDGDSGGNALQNYPVLQSFLTTGSTVQVQGTLDSEPFAQYTIEFFASPTCDPSGFGEGATFLGSTAVTTDGNGHASFATTLPVAVLADRRGTATATRSSTGSTSELSACIAIKQAGSPVAKASATPLSGNAPLLVQFSAAGSSAPGGTITSYSWTFGDGASSTLANPTHTYAAGIYTATLTITDDSNAHASDQVTITANTALRSSAIDLSASLQGQTVTVTGHVAVKNHEGLAMPGVTVWTTWTSPTGTTELQQATTDAAGIATFTTIGSPGSYLLTVTNLTGTGYAFDAGNSVLSKSITLTVSSRRRSVLH